MLNDHSRLLGHVAAHDVVLGLQIVFGSRDWEGWGDDLSCLPDKLRLLLRRLLGYGYRSNVCEVVSASLLFTNRGREATCRLVSKPIKVKL